MVRTGLFRGGIRVRSGPQCGEGRVEGPAVGADVVHAEEADAQGELDDRHGEAALEAVGGGGGVVPR